MVSRRLTYKLSIAVTLAVLAASWGARRCGAQDDPLPANREAAAVSLVDRSPPSLATRTQGSDWPRFLGATYDGKSPEQGIGRDWSEGKLKTRWHARLGTSYGIGSVADGRYFQLDRVGDAERLRCLHAETGRELWSQSQPVEYRDMYGYNNGPRSSPTVAGSAVYTLGVAGQLTCRAVSDGRLIWTVDTNTRYGVIQNFFGVGCSPLVLDDQVIVMVGGSPPEDRRVGYGALDRVSPNGSALVAFDADTGEERWRVGDYLASYSSPRPMVIDGKTVVLAFVREGLMAVDPAEGRELWFFPWRSPRLESVNAIVPVVEDRRVLISECYDLGAAVLEVSQDQPRLLWRDPPRSRQRALRAHWATPIALDGIVFGCSGRNKPDSDLRCFALGDGTLRWEDDRRVRSSLLYVDGHFVVLDEDGQMQLIDATTEELDVVTSIDLASPAEDRPALKEPCWAAPILARGLLYVRGRDHVLCMELGD